MLPMKGPWVQSLGKRTKIPQAAQRGQTNKQTTPNAELAFANKQEVFRFRDCPLTWAWADRAMTGTLFRSPTLTKAPRMDRTVALDDNGVLDKKLFRCDGEHAFNSPREVESSQSGVKGAKLFRINHEGILLPGDVISQRLCKRNKTIV